MRFLHPTGQAILTSRSLIQSNRWERPWALLRADFCEPVNVVKPKQVLSQPQYQESLVPILIKNGVIDVSHYSSLPLAA